MLNKEATRFVNRKHVKKMLANKELTNYHISRLNKLFETYTCKQLEDMHLTIAKFVLHDLNNYAGRLRRLKGINGTSTYTQLLRYGKQNFIQILTEQTDKKIKHFKNRTDYWIQLGFTAEEAIQQVSIIQTNRSLLSPVRYPGNRQYSARCIEYWLKKGYNVDDAKLKVGLVQKRTHTPERNAKWQKNP